jgi:hypothetical protein
VDDGLSDADRVVSEAALITSEEAGAAFRNAHPRIVRYNENEKALLALLPCADNWRLPSGPAIIASCEFKLEKRLGLAAELFRSSRHYRPKERASRMAIPS